MLSWLNSLVRIHGVSGKLGVTKQKTKYDDDDEEDENAARTKIRSKEKHEVKTSRLPFEPYCKNV